MPLYTLYKIQSVSRNPLRLVLLTDLTAWMCSQDATPASGPFCSLVRPCTVSSWNTKWHLLFMCMNHWNKSTEQNFFHSLTLRIPLSSCCYFNSAGSLATQKDISSSPTVSLGFFHLAIPWHDKILSWDNLQLSFCTGFHDLLWNWWYIYLAFTSAEGPNTVSTVSNYRPSLPI